jgi:hypothetical protein
MFSNFTGVEQMSTSNSNCSNKKFWEELVLYFPSVRHGLHCNNASIVVAGICLSSRYVAEVGYVCVYVCMYVYMKTRRLIREMFVGQTQRRTGRLTVGRKINLSLNLVRGMNVVCRWDGSSFIKLGWGIEKLIGEDTYTDHTESQTARSSHKSTFLKQTYAISMLSVYLDIPFPMPGQLSIKLGLYIRAPDSFTVPPYTVFVCKHVPAATNTRTSRWVCGRV